VIPIFSQLRKPLACIIACLCFGVAAVVPGAAQETEVPIAIVVHKDTSVEDLSLQDLRSIFLANQQFWPDRTRITLLVRAPKSDERDFVLNRIYQMDEAQFRQYWIAKMFRAEVPRGPKIVFSNDMALELVIAIPGSISFIKADQVSGDVRLLRVDGKLPDDDGYPLR
jgi:ABC-type phosphate transport system substrate-binding protein